MVESATLTSSENLRKIRSDLEFLVTQEFARVENNEANYLNKFIGLMESPLD